MGQDWPAQSTLAPLSRAPPRPPFGIPIDPARCPFYHWGLIKEVGLRLLIAIPVYNELRYVGRVLESIRRFHPEILVVDDASTDGTSQLLADRPDIQLIRHPVNRGYGQSLIDAFHYADAQGYDWVITMDCDEQHEPEMIPHFARQIRSDRWDLISGSRYKRQRQDNDLPPGDRRLINATITKTLNDLLGLDITDAFCGFKAHRVSAMRRLDLTERGYAFPMQLWPQVVRSGFRIAELPVRLIYKDPTRHFGGALDDPAIRLEHYLNVLKTEITRQPAEVTAVPEFSACSCDCR